MKVTMLILIFIVCPLDGIQANTHWMVTESGLIQPRVDSPFELARPYDLLAFLDQETYWNEIFDIYNDLSKRQILIDKLWNDVDKNTDIGLLVLSDRNCLRAGQLKQLDWYVSYSDDGSSRNIPDYVYQVTRPLFTLDLHVPDCKKISSLIFSMSTFEHLESMIHRNNLTMVGEEHLPEKVAPIMTLDQFGNWVARILKKNNTSWLHYHMASMYWRVRGKAPKAIECSRRAIHYAPREYKDLALLGLGTILHVSKMTEDAVIVLNAAVDHNPNSYLNHFHLANAYAVLCDFNNTSRHLNDCLKLNPTFAIAIKHRHGANCLGNVWQRLIVVKKALNQLRDELVTYRQKEVQMLKLQTSILKSMKVNEGHDYMSVVKNCEKMTELTGLDIKTLKVRSDRNSLIKYFLDGPIYNDLWTDKTSLHVIEVAFSLQRLARHIDKHSSIASELMVQSDLLRSAEHRALKEHLMPSSIPEITSKVNSDSKVDAKEDTKVDKKPINVEEELNVFEVGVHLFPRTMKINRNEEDFDKDPEWPSKSFCKEHAPNFPQNVEAIYPVFLPFENKGLMLGTLLTDKLGVPASEEHDLPWHPPTCPHDKASAAFTQKKKSQLVGEVNRTDHVKQKLLEYAGNGNSDLVRHMHEAEIGHRIYVAMKKRLAPKWILYTLSSLYWRARDNNVNALHCLLTASKGVPVRYKDIVLVSLASVCLEMGYFDEALTAAEEAFRLSLYEPATNFLLAELNMLKKHRHTHMFHLKQVVRVDKQFLGGIAKYVLYSWGCVLKEANDLSDFDYGKSDVCTQLEPGVNMVCDKEGTNCHVTNVKCPSHMEKADKSVLVRLLELKDESIRQAHVDNVDEDLFEPFIKNMPKDRADFLGHQLNLDTMMITISNSLKDCGPKGCHNVQAEEMSLREEDCTYHHLQLGYWLHVVSFKHPFSDPNLRLLDIISLSPSNKKVPECRVSGDPARDYFLERVMRVDDEHWEPVLTLMHQFAELFNYFDYVTLGAKIAKYLENKPRSWAGALSAGWWCGASGRGECAVRCLASALSLVPHAHAHHVWRAIVALLHTQSKQRDAKDIAYLSFYLSPKSKVEAFLVAVSHTCVAEFEQAVWMYRYALSHDERYLPAKACLHATICLMLFGDNAKEQAG
ncbi:tetratricopeptide repeat protein 17 [Papilio machaon]|uniref:tetratricopeptide repeat protein 17 n=1 Tax=Papilio machaon TaxID=76193 RepID=UPI001E665E26|nr:tetratricopeptide repeat protein 17 [Papilio machaon]